MRQIFAIISCAMLIVACGGEQKKNEKAQDKAGSVAATNTEAQAGCEEASEVNGITISGDLAWLKEEYAPLFEGGNAEVTLRIDKNRQVTAALDDNWSFSAEIEALEGEIITIALGKENIERLISEGNDMHITTDAEGTTRVEGSTLYDKMVKYENESAFLEKLRNWGYSIAGGLFGAGLMMQFLPSYVVTTRWSDGRTTKHTEEDPANFIIMGIKFALFVAALFVLCFTSFAIMAYSTVTGLYRNYQWKQNFDKIKEQINRVSDSDNYNKG